ncbi:MAG: hypothetical protein ACLPXB_05745 [Thiobacillaceae bacterium]
MLKHVGTFYPVMDRSDHEQYPCDDALDVVVAAMRKGGLLHWIVTLSSAQPGACAKFIGFTGANNICLASNFRHLCRSKPVERILTSATSLPHPIFGNWKETPFFSAA